MTPEAIAIEKIEGAVANDLIGDIRVTHGDISGLGSFHDWSTVCLTSHRFGLPQPDVLAILQCHRLLSGTPFARGLSPLCRTGTAFEGQVEQMKPRRQHA